jgi:hypothetical protein
MREKHAGPPASGERTAPAFLHSIITGTFPEADLVERSPGSRIGVLIGIPEWDQVVHEKAAWQIHDRVRVFLIPESFHTREPSPPFRRPP